ncbi:hypothetical protein [Nocardia brasiliensis]|uniref:hypothetical protein n=1 Tax=Nocardia brasiliensis TaxID=37326 RepID=UPI0004A781F1|nr:hypothetical protein [Nocardia brasiliensis]
MAQDDLITIRLTTTGLPAKWMVTFSRRLVADKLAANATIHQRPHPDSGTDVLVTLHTQQRHLPRISARATCADTIATFPLECDEAYRAWILAVTAA